MEVAQELLDNAAWRKAKRSGDSGDCIEVAPLPGGHVGIRDTRSPGERPLRRTSRGVGRLRGRDEERRVRLLDE
jgi:hypothetical protein